MATNSLPKNLIGHCMRNWQEQQAKLTERENQDKAEADLILKKVCFAAGFTVLLVALLIVRGG